MDIIQVLWTLFVYGGYAVRDASTCAMKDFDAQVQRLLADEMVSREEAHNISLKFNDLEDTLRLRWEGTNLFVYGSLLLGLGTKTSDVDTYAHIPNYNTSAEKYIVEETAKLLQKQPEKYGDVDAKLYLKVPMITYYDIALQRNIDLSFRSFSGVESTNLIAYYLNLDKRYTPLAAVIKLWSKAHQLTGKRQAPNYAIYLMVVFYLQQKNMSPSGFDMQAHLPPRVVDQWNINFEEIPYNTANDESLYELLGGFFKYYSEFDFKENCISPFAGRPIAKNDFRDLTRFPKEFSTFKDILKTGINEHVSLYTDICIQEMFQHHKNTGRRVKKEHAVRFINHFKSAAKMYDELSCNQFLTSILAKDQSDEVASEEKTFQKYIEL